MIPPECKRLAEVDFPIAEVSKHAAREKSLRHGHPSALHLWWARRPLASSRAVLMALLLPDPRDELCPPDFKTKARNALGDMRERPSGWDADISTDAGLRRTLLQFIADFANWDNASKQDYLDTARALVHAAHPEETPLVVDPFAGGGSIPLEALRLGCETFASDLNPVACLILKVMLEDIPRNGPGLADELRRAGREIKENAERELADLYPTDPDGATPIAYLWARTVRCEAPDCGAEIPLMRSMYLCNKPNRKRALRPTVTRPTHGPPQVTFEVFEPESDAEVHGGTVARARATCICCHAILPPDRVRTQIAAQKGGGDTAFDDHGDRIGGARMTAVVTLRPSEPGRHYRTPTNADYDAVYRAQQRIDAIIDEWERGGKQGLHPVPNEPTPAGGGSGAGRAFSVQRYGMLQWGDLFTARQKAALALLTDSVRKVESKSDVVSKCLALAVGRNTDYCSNLGTWGLSREHVRSVFARQALPMIWDFSESIPTSNSTGSWTGGIEWIARVIDGQCASYPGQVQSADATDHPLPDQSAGVWFTDPPYYDAIPYSDLSDYFLVWHKRAMPGHSLLRDPFDPDNILSPKTAEIVQDETKENDGRRKDGEWFEEMMARAFAEGRRVLREDGVGSVVFAHKTTAGWEALLSGMIRGGWTITGSWPIATEMAARLRARDSAALATSVHLVCRPRASDAGVGDWGHVLRELPTRVGKWMERLQSAGVRGADLVFACIGPALEIYSKHTSVETAEGREIALDEYLVRVWEAVGRAALENVLGTEEAQARNGMAGALEEDARLTALFLWTMQSTGEAPASGGNGGDEEADDAPRRRPSAYTLPFDVARRFAQPLGIHLVDWEQRIIRTEKGVVRLLPVKERGAQLFGERGADAIADDIESDASATPQLGLFPEPPPAVRGRARRRSRPDPDAPVDLEPAWNATTLDRVHAAMLLQASGRSNALRAMLRDEQDRSPDFMRLANALSALYPRGSEEKRLLDAMLLAAPR